MTDVSPSPPQFPNRATDDGPARCLACGYVVEGLEEARCPECGREFHPLIPASYTRLPPFRLVAYWVPGLLTALVGGLGMTLLMGGGWGTTGWSLWVGVPFAMGCLLGYGLRVGPVVASMYAILLGGGFIIGAMSAQLAGIFCGLILALVISLPIIAGLTVGFIVRSVLKSGRFEQRGYLPQLVFIAIPLLGGAAEELWPVRHATEVVTTSAVIDASAADCWESLQYYEEVEHEPPLILRIGLAHPLNTRGLCRDVGDVRTCLYNKGHLTKRITESRPGERLAFAVIDQAIGYERDVTLIDGAFDFEAIDDDRCRVTLTTRYEPHLGPRIAWRFGEHFAVHTLHEHVLEGMRREVTERAMQRDVATAGGADADRR